MSPFQQPQISMSFDANMPPMGSKNELNDIVRPEPRTQEESIAWSSLKGRLFDREEQKGQLLRSYERIIIPKDVVPAKEIVVVTGPSGTGKTTLARSTIQPRAVDDGCYFIYGKCEQIQKQEPFSPFVQAFTEFVDILMLKDNSEIERVKKAILEATKESDIEILANMIPAFRKILGDAITRHPIENFGIDEERVAKKSRPNTESPSIALFSRFLQSVCSLDHPIVFLLDDWQWLDPSSLALLHAIASAKSTTGFMLLGTCRGDEVGLGDELSCILRSLEKDSVLITDVQVGNLNAKAVADILADLLCCCHKGDVDPLALKIHQLTKGNIFYVQQCLIALHDKRLLYFDKKWCWDLALIDRSKVSQGCALVQRLSVESASLISPTVKEVLKVSACLGSRFSRLHVGMVVIATDREVDAAFATLLRKGILSEQEHGKYYKWTHDRFQHAAYTLIPQNERTEFLVFIGRKMLRQLSGADLSENKLLIANLLLSDLSYLQEEQEMRDAASLFCTAGYRAAQSSAFEDSATYFRAGIKLLPPNRWKESYEVTLRLHDGAAEMAFCLGNTTAVDSLADEVIKNARCIKDKVRAYETKILSLSARNDMHEAIRVGFELLRKVGEPLPNRPSLLRNATALLSTRFMLRNKTGEDILSLPPLKIWSKLVFLRVLNLLFPAILRVRTDLSILYATKGIKTTLRFGLSPMACPAFMFLGMLVCHPIGSIPEGTKYCDIGYAIYEKYNPTDLRSRILCVQSAFCKPWTEPIRGCLPVRLSAASSGMLSGDIELAFLNHIIYCLEGFCCGFQLDENLNRLADLKKQYDGLQQETVMVYLRCLLQLGQNLLGKGLHGSDLCGEYFKSEDISKSGQVDHAKVAVYRLCQLYLALFLGDYERASEIGKKLVTGNLDGMSAFSVQSMTFMAGLAEVIYARESGRNKPRAGKAALKKLVRWSGFAPENVFSRVYFMEAERYAMEGKRERAFRKYKLAIDQASEQGFVHEEAFAYERAGVSLREWRNNDEALNCFHRAISLYRTWGSPPKVRQMEKYIAETEESSKYF